MLSTAHATMQATVQATVQATMQATMQASDLATVQVTDLATDLAPRMHPASTTPQAKSVERQVLGLCQPFTRLNQPTSTAHGGYSEGRVNE